MSAALRSPKSGGCVRTGDGRPLFGDALMMMDHLGHDEAQELLGEDRVESGLLGERPQPRDLSVLALGIGGRQPDRSLVTADVLGDLEPLGEQVDQGGIDVVDARSVLVELLVGHANVTLPDRRLGARSRARYVRRMSDLPLLFVDHPFPDLYRDLVEGRAVVCGSGSDDSLDVADGVIAGATRHWNSAAFALAPRLRVISRVGVGYDNVDVADAAAADIVVCNTPLAPTVSTAEHTMALLFAITKHLPHQIARARQGLPGEPVGRSLELDGRVLGLIGIGRIASRVALTAQALGIRVVASDPAIEIPPIPGVELIGLPDLLAAADVVSIHAPALPSTIGMFDAQTLAAMKPGAYLVNCARGVLVDHDALVDALDRGHLSGAALDVTDPEPLPADHPLLDRTNVVITPHVASASVAGRRRLYEHAVENALAVLDGRAATIVSPPNT